MNENSEKVENRIKKTYRNNTPLPEKQFKIRNSLLIDLFEKNPHVKSVYNIFIASLIYLGVNEVVQNYFEKGDVTLGFDTIIFYFGKLHITLLFWIGYLLIMCSIYLCFILWAKIRSEFPPKSNILKIWDYPWLLLLIGYYITSFWLTSFIQSTFQLPLASSAIILLEKIRFLMKAHSFIRSNAPKVLNYKTHSDKELKLPTFSKFLYFLFAPTFIYRDEYPRTEKIRWNFVMLRFLEIVAGTFYYSFIANKCIMPAFEDFERKSYTWSRIFTTINNICIASSIIKLNTFFIILHSTQNLFAELLRFGDRQFYEDWWTCSSFSEFFRKWNIVVNDWLYAFIYKDMYEIVAPRKKNLAKVTVFLVSALTHEWIMYEWLGFFAPIMFILFVFGGALLSFVSFINGKYFNILFLWYGFSMGMGIIVSTYCMEYYAIKNCPTEIGSKNYFLPRMITCNIFQ